LSEVLKRAALSYISLLLSALRESYQNLRKNEDPQLLIVEAGLRFWHKNAVSSRASSIAFPYHLDSCWVNQCEKNKVLCFRGHASKKISAFIPLYIFSL
jgi:hypothetical protein